MPVPQPRITCSEEGCNNSFVDHKWGNHDAYKAGWFVMKDGTAYCFDHNPPWVAEWRAKQKGKKKDTEIPKVSTLADVRRALNAAVEKNPYLLHAHATYTSNPDGSITIQITPKLKEE